MTEPSLEAQIDAFWNLGRLRFLLDDHQLKIYDNYRAWEPNARKVIPGQQRGLSRIFVALCGRQVGKTHVGCTISTEECTRRPGSMRRYITALQQDITEIVIPNMETILETCPARLRPEYRDSNKGRHEGYYFPNGSVLRLVGLDKNPRGVRGRTCDGDAVSEAGFMKNLKRNVISVLLPQYLRRPWARMFLETSAPEEALHDLDEIFIPDAKERGAYVELTIDDNTSLDEETKAEFLEPAYRYDPATADREYRNIRTRDQTRTVVPEFDAPTIQKPESKHVVAFERPKHAIAMCSMDAGMRDLMAMLWGYWDAERAKLCIERDWAKRNANTSVVADAIKQIERELYGAASPFYMSGAGNPPTLAGGFGLKKPDGFTWWDGSQYRANPAMRVSDTDTRLIGDLIVEQGITVQNTLKDDAEAALFSLRNAFRFDKIEIHPRCKDLIEHLTAAVWNDKRMDYLRTERHGHYDLLDALVYLWRMIQPMRSSNPFPPQHVERGDANVLFHEPPQQVSHTLKKMQDAFGGRRGSWR